jgi:hypothetical protein
MSHRAYCGKATSGPVKASGSIRDALAMRGYNTEPAGGGEAKERDRNGHAHHPCRADTLVRLRAPNRTLRETQYARRLSAKRRFDGRCRPKADSYSRHVSQIESHRAGQRPRLGIEY